MMNTKTAMFLAAALAVVSTPLAAAQVTITGTVTITKPVPPAPTVTLSFVPANPTVQCGAAPGSQVSAVKAMWSDGTTALPPLTLTAGGPEFALVNGNIVVNPAGTALANLCATLPVGGTPKTITVTTTN